MPSLAPPLLAAFRLTLALTTAHVAFGGARLALTLQGLQMQLSPLSIGILMSLLMVLPSLVSVHVGRWADRVGFKRPTMIGFVILVIGCLLPAVLPTWPALCASAVLVGTGYSIGHVAVNNAIGRAAGAPLRARAFGISAMAFSVSALAGPMLAGLTIDHIGFSAAFAVMAAWVAIPAAILWREAPPAIEEPAAGRAKGSFMDLLRHRPLRMVLIMSALVSTGWDLFTFFAPLHAARAGLSATAIGFVVGAFGVGSFAARMALPALLRKYTPWQILSSAVFATAAGYCVFAFTGSAATMLLVALALGAALGAGQPLIMALLHATAPDSRTGEAVGLRTALISFGQMVMPLLFGALGTAVGLMPIFVATGALMASGSAWVRKRFDPPRE